MSCQPFHKMNADNQRINISNAYSKIAKYFENFNYLGYLTRLTAGLASVRPHLLQPMLVAVLLTFLEFQGFNRLEKKNLIFLF